MINEGVTAINVEIRSKSKKMFEKKLDRLKELSRQQNGMDPYSGSWNTIDAFRYIKDPFPERKKWTKNKIRDVKMWMLDHCDKREALIIKTSKSYYVVGWAAI